MSKLKSSNGNGHTPAADREDSYSSLPEGFQSYSKYDYSPDDGGLDNMQEQEAMAAAINSGAPMPGPAVPIQLKSLRNGCYLSFFYPASVLPIPVLQSFYYQGTIRIEKTAGYTKASGDLYYAKNLPVVFPGVLASSFPNPANGIPIFSRGNYTYYLRITKVLHGFTISGSFELEFEMHKYDKVAKAFNTPPKKAKAKMAWSTAPAGYPDAGQYLKGSVKDSAGVTLGTLYMGWVDKYYRKATIEIDTVTGSETTIDSGTGENWQTVGNKIGWRITRLISSTNLVPPSGDSWSDAEMHSRMLASRDMNDLDKEWRYHILCVKRLDSTERGIMYDAYGTDSNNVPREGMGISSHWVIPNANPWGLVKGLRFGTAKAPYFRTAVHEIGHAMGLYHNASNNGFMHTTPDIAASATPANPFPNNIIWNYAPDDQNRLRHFPDIVVRPGGTSFGISYGSIPISDESADTTSIMDQAGLFDDFVNLDLQPIMEVFPLGAPVRLNFSIVNMGDTEIEVPENLSMKKAEVFGFVTDPSGTKRSFSPIVRCADAETNMLLKPGKKASESLTLLRGKEGPLFLQGGYHIVEVYIKWDINGAPVCVKGTASVMISGASNDDHARAAKAIFDTPDTHLVLVLGGDHLTDGIAAIQQALKNDILRPHYAYIEAKRVGKAFGKRKPQKEKAKALLTKTAVLNAKEKEKASDLTK
ncbi:MAG: hypothetical protein ABIQ88_18300 [Chitinophagaceae bacterium]